jgi:hypothetical protein
MKKLRNQLPLGVTMSDYKKGEVQTIIVSKEIARTREEATEIARKFGAEHLESDMTSTSWRFRQRSPDDFMQSSFKTFKPEGKPGVSIVYGRLRG